MKINTIRFIDKYIGILICLILTIFNRIALLLHFKKNGREQEETKRILMIKFYGLGSIVLASPAIKAVRDRYPEAKIYFLTFLQNKDICESLGLVDQVLTIESRSFLRFIAQTIKTLIYLRGLKLDLAIDFEFLARFSSIMTYLSGAKKTVEFYSDILWRGDLSKTRAHYNCYFHVTENFLNLVRALGIKEKTSQLLQPRVLSESKIRIDALFKDNNISPQDKVVIININSSDTALERRWPKENFSFLLDKLLEEYGFKAILIGSKEDKTYVDSFLGLLKHRKNVLNLAGSTNIRELITLISRSQLFISNDSGPLHIAEAFNIPTVSFFGPETPVLYGPQGEEHLVFYKNLLCSPCMNIHNSKLVNCLMDNQCLKDISANEVYAAVARKYAGILTGNNYENTYHRSPDSAYKR